MICFPIRHRAFLPKDLLIGIADAALRLRLVVYYQSQECQEVQAGCGVWLCKVGKQPKISNPIMDPVFENNVHPHRNGTSDHDRPTKSSQSMPEIRM